jgi:hypothetical protein
MDRLSRVAVLFAFVGFSCLTTLATAAEDFAGKYLGQNLSVELKLDNAAYTGTIALGDQQFPVKAHAAGDSLQGTFSSGGNDFDFTATLADRTLTLSTGGATYTLKKEAAAVNPLAAQQPLNPLAVGGQAVAAADAPAGYTVVTTTDSGKALTASKPDAANVLAAMKSVFPDLEKFFGARPEILGAYENTRDHRSGSATFAVNQNGHPLKGLVSCKVGDHGASVAVVYCRADATPAEWKKLLADAPADARAAAAVPPLKEYDFPDGTGSIGIADGWTTNAQSCMQTVQIKGPADQVITIGFVLSVQTPDSPMVQMQLQLEANARQWGMQPPPRPKVCVAPYTDPADDLARLVPQLSEFNQQAGSFGIEVDHLKTLPQEVQPCLPGGKAALLSYGVTHIDAEGTRTHFKAGSRAEITPIGNGAWMFYMTEIAGPDKTFDADVPVMLAMINSLKENAQVIADRTRQNIDDSNRRFAAMQQAHKEQTQAFDNYNKAWEHRELVQDRSFADFDEVIRGDRTVMDTQTGERASVDLGNVDRIVDHLNEGDPGRYKQIPLRDELYPLPGGQGQ